MLRYSCGRIKAAVLVASGESEVSVGVAVLEHSHRVAVTAGLEHREESGCKWECITVLVSTAL